MKKNVNQIGSVSLFVVIFVTLLITVVTVSFIRIMIQDQQQASATDLSQSAYDSAQAGVEDAKRAILLYKNCATNGEDCDTLKNKFNLTGCNQSLTGLKDIDSLLNDPSNVNNKEIKIQTSGSNALNQAYTCVKINMQTDDYLGIADQDKSEFIPLTGVRDFNTVKIEWFGVKDLHGSTNKVDLDSSTLLLNQDGAGGWNSSSQPNRPPIMRTQLVQFGSDGFYLSDFDGDIAVGSNSNTLFLYPSSSGLDNTSFILNTRKSASNNFPVQIKCKDNMADSQYACTAILTLPNTIGTGNRNAFLNLKALYKNANYKISLYKDGTLVKFNSVQPEVDSTGRANDVFRRVKSRVQLVDTSSTLYPNAEINVSGDFCKNFMITDNPADYPLINTGNSCTP